MNYVAIGKSKCKIIMEVDSKRRGKYMGKIGSRGNRTCRFGSVGTKFGEDFRWVLKFLTREVGVMVALVPELRNAKFVKQGETRFFPFQTYYRQCLWVVPREMVLKLLQSSEKR